MIPAGAPDRAAAAGFTVALALRFADAADAPAAGRRALVWITEDFAAIENGGLYGPGLAAFGLDPARLILVRAARAAEALWALEEALKCRALAAAVCELWDARAYDLTASRRLALAARASGAPGLLLLARPPPASAAAARFAVAAAALADGAPGKPLPGKPLPGLPAFDLRLLRARGAAQLDPERRFSLIFDPAEGYFREPDPAPQPHFGALSADAADRPHPPLARGGDQRLRRA